MHWIAVQWTRIAASVSTCLVTYSNQGRESRIASDRCGQLGCRQGVRKKQKNVTAQVIWMALSKPYPAAKRDNTVIAVQSVQQMVNSDYHDQHQLCANPRAGRLCSGLEL